MKKKAPRGAVSQVAAILEEGSGVEKIRINTAPPDEGRRLDLFLAGAAAGLSRSQAQKLIEEGSVYVNDRPCIRKNYRVSRGDTVVFSPPEPSTLSPRAEQIPLDIVYEDDALLVINKPRGMVVHPAPGHRSGTLVNALLNHCSTLSTAGGEERPGIVHRLDKDTTGLLVVAKTDYSHRSLAAQLKSRTMRREYLALAHGRVRPAAGRIEAPIGRHPRHRLRMAVVPGGREAVTRYRVLAYPGPFSLLHLLLESGRTHQIRVHLSFIRHPLVGDPLYGPAASVDLPPSLRWGQALHARRLTLIHPCSGRLLQFSAPLPCDFREGLRYLREHHRTS